MTEERERERVKNKEERMKRRNEEQGVRG